MPEQLLYSDTEQDYYSGKRVKYVDKILQLKYADRK